ncbi:MAG: hypothetical protein KC766_15225 [Myxococcales bacterium]|nr:hypothetical protein [Myxococcales bacterium]
MSPTPQQVKAALSELKLAARKEPKLAFSGCLGLLERLGTHGSEYDEVLTSIATWLPQVLKRSKPAADELSDWQERLYQALSRNPERLGALADQWGRFCLNKTSALRWAERIRKELNGEWRPPHLVAAYLRCLLPAERYAELLEALDELPNPSWEERLLGVTALAAGGDPDAAVRYAETHGTLKSPTAVAQACEKVLIDAGRKDEAYARYALRAGEASTYVAWFRAVRKKYPARSPESILADLVAATPEEPGKWFAAAKDAKLFKEAIALVERSQADVRTLLRAAHDYGEKEPWFAMEAGLAALRWMLEAPHFEITNTEIWNAYNATRVAANAADRRDEAMDRLRELLGRDSVRDRVVTRVLSRELGLS